MAPYAAKGSCRFLENKALLSPDELCAECDYVSSISNSALRKNTKKEIEALKAEIVLLKGGVGKE